MLNNFFRETMDSFGIRGAELARLANCSHNHISQIRHGKSFPPTSTFWELIEICEEIAPGFKEALGKKIAGSETTDKSTRINSNVKSKNSLVFQVHGDANDVYRELKNISPEVFDELLKAIALKVVSNSSSKNSTRNKRNDSSNSKSEEALRETILSN